MIQHCIALRAFGASTFREELHLPLIAANTTREDLGILYECEVLLRKCHGSRKTVCIAANFPLSDISCLPQDWLMKLSLESLELEEYIDIMT